MTHALKRQKVKWGSFGKLHNEPLKMRYIKDLSDSHLLHIIAWVRDNLDAYDKETLQLMENEQKYRKDNYIFINDYQ